MKLAYHTFGFGSPFQWIPAYPLDEALRRISEIGYQGVEIGAARPHAWPSDLDSTSRRDIRETATELDLDICALTPCTHNLNIASPISQERNDALRHYRECLQLAEDLQAPIVVFVPGWRVFGMRFSKAWSLALSAAASLAEEAENRSLTLAIEPINQFRVNLINTVEQAVRMIEEIKSPSFKLMLDTAHMVLAREDPLDVIREHGEYLVHVHCADTPATAYQRVSPGTGSFAYKIFLSELMRIGYSGFLSVEVWGGNPNQLARKSYEFLTSMLTELGD